MPRVAAVMLLAWPSIIERHHFPGAALTVELLLLLVALRRYHFPGATLAVESLLDLPWAALPIVALLLLLLALGHFFRFQCRNEYREQKGDVLDCDEIILKFQHVYSRKFLVILFSQWACGMQPNHIQDGGREY
ncbi:hypothetical protein JG688_00009881 [Phytophthora aleatoria]|uniref:Uncharacterized protein n=1 Tax=Phytophthora aleatoria TaxID=2496075 RepID=A0A8J5IQZ4_9STRA|nr:hypothetical protein JG688_00009881 [Phytophthora aleatoria]